MDHKEVALKLLGDVVAAFAVLGSIVKLLPAIAAGFAIVWYLIQIYEKATNKSFADTGIGSLIRRLTK